MIKLYFSAVASFIFFSVYSQQAPIPLMRQIFHDKIDQSQKSIDKTDHKQDNLFKAGSDEDVNQQLTYALFTKVDEMQNSIEADADLDANNKIKFLRGLNDALAAFESAYQYKKMNAVELPNLLSAYNEAMQLEKRDQSMVPVVEQYEIEIGEILIKTFAFQKDILIYLWFPKPYRGYQNDSYC